MKAIGLENSLLLNDRMVDIFKSSLSKTKDRMHNIELSFYFEPNYEQSEAHKVWSNKIAMMINRQDLDPFPTRHDIREELRKKHEDEYVEEVAVKRVVPNQQRYYQSLEKLKKNRNSSTSKQLSSKSSSSKSFGDKKDAISSHSLHSSTSSLPPWIGPGTYDNIDPDCLRSDHRNVTYSSVFKSVSREKDQTNETRGLRTKIRQRYETLRTQYLLSLNNKNNPNQDYLLTLRDLDDESSDIGPIRLIHSKLSIPGSRALSKGSESSSSLGSSSKYKSDAHAFFSSRQISDRSIQSRHMSPTSTDISVPNTLHTHHHTSTIPPSMNNEKRHSIATSSNSRRPSTLPTGQSSRRVSVNETTEFASKLLETDTGKYNATKKDYTLGGLSRQPHSGVLSLHEDSVEKDEHELMRLTLFPDLVLHEPKSGKMSRKNSLNDGKTDNIISRKGSMALRNDSISSVISLASRKGSIAITSNTSNIKIPSQSSIGRSISEFDVASVTHALNKLSSEQTTTPQGVDFISSNNSNINYNHHITNHVNNEDEESDHNHDHDHDIITPTYPPLTDDIGPLIRKWYQIKDIYSPDKPQISKYLKGLVPVSHINLDGLLLPGEGHTNMESVVEETADSMDLDVDETGVVEGKGEGEHEGEENNKNSTMVMMMMDFTSTS